ncbi:MAG: peptidoglycan editing factor PgeF [Gloeobacterales cyanobacterium]
MWQLKASGDLSWLECELLQPFPHGFFTRNAHRSPGPLASVLGYPEDQAYHLTQIHSALVFDAENVTAGLQGDGLVSATPGITAWAKSADCVPALLLDPECSVVAAVHAGWRGTAAQILPQAIQQMILRGARPERIRVALGPAISGDYYPVHQTVAKEVVKTILHPAKALLPDAEADKVRLDVREVNRQQALSLGVLALHIALAPHCTYQEERLFFSYRREGRTGIQFSGIGI